ncbi:MAG: aminopeptidase, partial [Gammaproteobacteria bacterium]
QEYAKIKARGEGTRYYDWWFSMPLNNASLLTVSTYFQLVPAFSSIIAEHDGDLQAFFEFSRALAKQPKEARDKTLERYLNL